MRLPIVRPKLGSGRALFIAIILGIGLIASLNLRSVQSGPEQPIPFSHRVHAGTKQLSCFFCHQFGMESKNPGMPPVDKCLLCHNVIAVNFPPIAKIHSYKEQGKGIPWQRVNKVPDFVHFSHEIHLAKGFDCGVCHGNVKAMDRVSQANVFTMDFCVTCHKENKASRSCFVCHY